MTDLPKFEIYLEVEETRESPFPVHIGLEEYRTCGWIGEERYKITEKIKGKGRDRRITPRQSSLGIMIEGAIAEWALAKCLGCTLEISRSGPDNGVDMVYKGVRIAVKWTRYKNDPRITIFSPYLLRRADAIFLITDDARSNNGLGQKIEGYIKTVDFWKKAEKVDWGYGEHDSVRWSSLTEFSVMCKKNEDLAHLLEDGRVSHEEPVRWKYVP